MCAQWIGARYWRQQDHHWVARVDKDPKNKSRAVHRVIKTPKARMPVARTIITRQMIPVRRRM